MRICFKSVSKWTMCGPQVYAVLVLCASGTRDVFLCLRRLRGNALNASICPPLPAPHPPIHTLTLIFFCGQMAPKMCPLARGEWQKKIRVHRPARLPSITHTFTYASIHTQIMPSCWPYTDAHNSDICFRLTVSTRICWNPFCGQAALLLYSFANGTPRENELAAHTPIPSQLPSPHRYRHTRAPLSL